ncbi:MBL fold metallo-hydrolase [Saccharothrix australiensis]|uniref:Glyoxylase-like metal-dependent hydrolase (Beta-lactamase superfamily II) n=1 Tax=Saccharothrix australiensis TaxID=2072 RepID=A0A495VRY1_9PSEU|nr:MBL fold metallo-hydrolase [Saccharothrix australiensis]RKT52109.1 glyoxylase-like metal-dependent hydrolase (beta-lactamase superfamily II) [Saccharothrix australiensis]
MSPAYGQLREVTPFASVVLAENPSVMTLEGTNTWLLRAPGSSSCAVVDPGPLDRGHLARVAACGPVDVVLLTHGHADHSEGAAEFGALVGAPVRAVDPALRLGSEGLADGDVVEAGGLEIRVLGTPGHTDDSLSFLVGNAVLTGDTVLGRGTTVLDGRLRDYLESLKALADLPPDTVVLPGHGPELPDVVSVARSYLAHREQRLAQVRAAVTRLGGSPTAREVVELVYADVDPSLWPAAEWSVRAQLDYLSDT